MERAIDSAATGRKHASGQVGAMAVLRSLNLADPSQRSALNEAIAAFSGLIGASDGYVEAEAALANRELGGINVEPHENLQRRVHAARQDLESALARVNGGAA